MLLNDAEGPLPGAVYACMTGDDVFVQCRKHANQDKVTFCVVHPKFIPTM